MTSLPIIPSNNSNHHHQQHDSLPAMTRYEGDLMIDDASLSHWDHRDGCTIEEEDDVAAVVDDDGFHDDDDDDDNMSMISTTSSVYTTTTPITRNVVISPTNTTTTSRITLNHLEERFALGHDYIIKPQDVRSGGNGSRGSTESTKREIHPGNRRLFLMIQMLRNKYHTKENNNNNNTSILHHVVDVIRAHGGHFLSYHNGMWYDMGNQRAREKVQILFEKQPPMISSMNNIRTTSSSVSSSSIQHHHRDAYDDYHGRFLDDDTKPASSKNQPERHHGASDPIHHESWSNSHDNDNYPCFDRSRVHAEDIFDYCDNIDHDLLIQQQQLKQLQPQPSTMHNNDDNDGMMMVDYHANDVHEEDDDDDDDELHRLNLQQSLLQSLDKIMTLEQQLLQQLESSSTSLSSSVPHNSTSTPNRTKLSPTTSNGKSRFVSFDESRHHDIIDDINTVDPIEIHHHHHSSSSSWNDNDVFIGDVMKPEEFLDVLQTTSLFTP